MTYATTKTFTPKPPKKTIECPDCGGRADYYKIESGYFEASCPDCGYYETGFDMGEAPQAVSISRSQREKPARVPLDTRMHPPRQND